MTQDRETILHRHVQRRGCRLAKANAYAQTAHDLGLNPSLIRKWKDTLEEDPERPFPGSGNAREQELAQRQRQRKRLEQEKAVLKKAVGIFSVPRR